jgi:hypothetical protein
LINFVPVGNSLKFTVTQVIAPFAKLIAIPLTHPILEVESTRRRCLVAVSCIFDQRLEEMMEVGDMVLAVDGTPVSKPEQYDKALETPENGYALLYLLDGRTLQETFIREAQLLHSDKFGSIFLTRKDPPAHSPPRMACYSITKQDYSGTKYYCYGALIDPASHRMYDPVQFVHCCTTKGNRRCPPYYHPSKYQSAVLGFFKAYNAVMEERMAVLQKSLAHETWQRQSPIRASAVPVQEAVAEVLLEGDIDVNGAYIDA